MRAPMLGLMLLTLLACTPSYTVDSVREAGRFVGLVDDYEVKRWGNFTLAKNSHIVISLHALPEQDVVLMAPLIQDVFNTAFAKAEVTPGNLSGINYAVAVESDFLIRASLLNSIRASDVRDYKSAILLLEIVDTHTVQVIDKATLSRSNKVLSGSLAELLEPPLLAFAKGLAGEL
jgi:hypothetical protein